MDVLIWLPLSPLGAPTQILFQWGRKLYTIYMSLFIVECLISMIEGKPSTDLYILWQLHNRWNTAIASHHQWMAIHCFPHSTDHSTSRQQQLSTKKWCHVILAALSLWPDILSPPIFFSLGPEMLLYLCSIVLILCCPCLLLPFFNLWPILSTFLLISILWIFYFPIQVYLIWDMLPSPSNLKVSAIKSWPNFYSVCIWIYLRHVISHPHFLERYLCLWPSDMQLFTIKDL